MVRISPFILLLLAWDGWDILPRFSDIDAVRILADFLPLICYTDMSE